jgi:hypothetical protein
VSSLVPKTYFQEGYVKTVRNLFLAIVAFSLLATSALAQKGSRANKGGAVTGIARSDKVQAENRKSDKDRDPNPSKGSKAEKTRTRAREGWEKNAKHKAKGHSH